MVEFDAIIVWAGPAGSRLSFLLWTDGYKVLLIDKEKFPRNKPCGWGIALETLQYLWFDLPETIIESRVTEINFFFRNTKIIKKYDSTISYTVKREKFDQFLLKKAIDIPNVTFRTCKNLTLSKEGNIPIINIDWEQIKSTILVWADGANSIVKKSFFSPTKFLSKKAVAVAFDHCKIKTGEFKKNAFYFFFWLDHWGYKWIFPNSGDEFNIWVGLFSEKANDIKEKLSQFSNDCGWESDRNMVWHLLPYWCNWGNNGNWNILLIWDAAALIDPFTGEWIGNAILSANIAHKAIKDSCSSRTSSTWRLYNRMMLPIYIDMWLMLIFTKIFHWMYSLSEKIVIRNDFVIDWYVDVSVWKIRPKVFFFRFLMYLPVLLWNTYIFPKKTKQII